jgi:hypothetical protein
VSLADQAIRWTRTRGARRSVDDEANDCELLLKPMSSDVTVTGTLVKKGGVQMIYVDSVK